MVKINFIKRRNEDNNLEKTTAIKENKRALKWLIKASSISAEQKVISIENYFKERIEEIKKMDLYNTRN